MNTDEARAACEALGLPVSYARAESTGMPELVAALDAAASVLSSAAHDRSPTSFDPADPLLRGFPRPRGWDWRSARRALERFGGPGAIVRLPLFWQIETPLYRAGKAAGVFLYFNERGNMPLGAAAIELASAATIVTDTDDAARFATFLESKPAPAQNLSWIIIHRIDGAWTLPTAALAPGSKAAQEVHLFPGVSVLEQCDALMEEKSPLFHASDECSIDLSTGRLTGFSPLPLVRYQLPIALRSAGTCRCGREIIARTEK